MDNIRILVSGDNPWISTDNHQIAMHHPWIFKDIIDNFCNLKEMVIISCGTKAKASKQASGAGAFGCPPVLTS